MSEEVIEMIVGGLVLDPNTQAPVVVLKDPKGEICLPIWIGVAEATSIAGALKQLNMSRPLTHDLMYDMLFNFGVKLERVVISDLREGTYYSDLVVSQDGKILVFDSRPSDAIALALRANAPIFVSSEVLDQAKRVFTVSTEQSGVSDQSETDGEEKENEGESTGKTSQNYTDFTSIEKEKWDELLKSMNPEDFKYKI